MSILGPLFHTAGHTVRMQHGVTASAGQRRGDLEIRNYVQGQAGRRSLVFDPSITHDRFGSSTHVHQNGLLSHPQDLDAPLRLAAQRKTNSHVIVKSLIPKSKGPRSQEASPLLEAMTKILRLLSRSYSAKSPDKPCPAAAPRCFRSCCRSGSASQGTLSCQRIPP